MGKKEEEIERKEKRLSGIAIDGRGRLLVIVKEDAQRKGGVGCSVERS